MKKKILFFTMVFVLSICMIPKAFAKEVTANDAASLKQAIEDATEATTIKLETTIDLSETDNGAPLLIDNGKDITIDLNGNDIVAEKNVIQLKNSSLKLIGKGAIKESTPYFYGVVLIGSSLENETYLSVGKDVTIEAFYPVTVDVYKENSVPKGYSYNVKVDVYGTLIAKDDEDGYSGASIYVNGSIKDATNYPEINVKDGATLNATGLGIFQAGYAKTTIGKATISGASGIGIKAGILTLNNTTVQATGDYVESVLEPSGIEATGAAIQIESNKGYAEAGIAVSINGGTYTSKNNAAIQEYADEEGTNVTKIEITDGTFQSAEGIKAIDVSESFEETYEETGFITGGTFLSGEEKSDVSIYVSSELEQDEEGTIIDPNAKGEEPKEEPKEEETDEENPNTYDGISSYLLLGGISLVGLTAAIHSFKKKKAIN